MHKIFQTLLKVYAITHRDVTIFFHPGNPIPPALPRSDTERQSATKVPRSR